MNVGAAPVADHRFLPSFGRGSRSSVHSQNRSSLFRRSVRLSYVEPEALILPTDSHYEILRKKLLAGSKCHYPKYALPIDEVMKLTSLVDHQTLLQQGKLVRVDENEDRPVVFLSHQWVPSCTHFLHTAFFRLLRTQI